MKQSTAVKAIKLANDILGEMAKSQYGCIANDIEKRDNICFLPRQKARLAKCQDCQYWRG